MFPILKMIVVSSIKIKYMDLVYGLRIILKILSALDPA